MAKNCYVLVVFFLFFTSCMQDSEEETSYLKQENLAQEKKISELISSLKRAIKEIRSLSEFYYKKAVAEEEKENFSKALEYLDILRDSFPKSAYIERSFTLERKIERRQRDTLRKIFQLFSSGQKKSGEASMEQFISNKKNLRHYREFLISEKPMMIDPILFFDVNELLSEYRSNTVLANDKYGNRKLVLTGKISSIEEFPINKIADELGSVLIEFVLSTLDKSTDLSELEKEKKKESLRNRELNSSIIVFEGDNGYKIWAWTFNQEFAHSLKSGQYVRLRGIAYKPNNFLGVAGNVLEYFNRRRGDGILPNYDKFDVILTGCVEVNRIGLTQNEIKEREEYIDSFIFDERIEKEEFKKCINGI